MRCHAQFPKDGQPSMANFFVKPANLPVCICNIYIYMLMHQNPCFCNIWSPIMQYEMYLNHDIMHSPANTRKCGHHAWISWQFAMTDLCLKMFMYSLQWPWSHFASVCHSLMHTLCYLIIPCNHVTFMWYSHDFAMQLWHRYPSMASFCKKVKNIITHT